MCIKEPILAAVGVVGSQTELARRLATLTGKPIRQGHVWKWIRSGRVPAEQVLPIERATGGKVTRYELRPDLYPLESTDGSPNTSESEAVPPPGDGYRASGVPAAPPPCDEAGREGVA